MTDFEIESPPQGHATTARLLGETQPWVRLMSIVTFITGGLMIVVGLGAGAAFAATGNTQMLAILVFYPLMGVLYFFPAMHLTRYAGRIGDFVAHGRQTDLEGALDAQRSFWKFVGILTIVGIIGTCLLLVAALVLGVVTANQL